MGARRGGESDHGVARRPGRGRAVRGRAEALPGRTEVLPGRAEAVPVRAGAPGEAPWLRAPLVLLRYPSLFVAVFLSAFVLAAATAAAPLFLSSAGSTALRGGIERTTTWDAGLTVTAYGRVAGPSGGSVTGAGVISAQELFLRRGAFLGQLTAGVPGLGPEVVTILGTPATVSGLSSGGARAGVQLVARTGFSRYVQQVVGGGPSGAWLPASVAGAMGARPGDRIAVRVGDRSTTVPVQAVYRDGSVQAGADFWSPLAAVLGSSGAGGATAPPLLLMEPEVFQRLAGPLDQVGRLTWQFPLVATSPSLPEAERLAARVQATLARLGSRGDPQVAALFGTATSQSSLPELVHDAAATADGISGPVDAVSYVGRIIGLGAIAAAALFAVRRRRIEMDVLSVRGSGPLGLGGKVAAEAVLPVAAGALAGWGAALALVRALGPGGGIDPAAGRSAAFQVAWVCALGLLLLGAVAGVAAARAAEAEDGGRLREALARAPWEIPVLVLAAVAYLEVAVRSGGAVRTSGGAGRVDVLVLLFPVLFVAAAAGLATRGLAGLLPRIRAAGGRRSASAYLASRRLAGATGMAMLLVTAVAVAMGVLVYAGVLETSVGHSLETKALVLSGAETKVALPGGQAVPPRVPFPATVVEHVAQGTILPTAEPVEVLAVDPATFAAGAATEVIAGGPPPSRFLPELRSKPGAPVPVLVAGGGLPPSASLDVGPVRLRIAAVGTATAFPGMTTSRPLVVLDRSALDRAIRLAGTSLAGVAGDLELWARAPASEVLAALRRASIQPGEVTTVEGVRDRPEFQAVRWTFGFLEALGVLGGLVAAVAVLLFLQARQRAREVSYALAARMGLGRAAHRRSVLVEVGGMLAVAFGLGVLLGTVGAAAVVGRIDLLPSVPPTPSVRLPVAIIGLAAAGLAVVSVAGAWLVQRQADRANVAEVLRRAA
jgi:putative ABC transport system permease protein